jgi:hypothetical protein
MSLIGLSLNGLLILMLGAALVMGLRLNKRLKTLRESQAGFAAAVLELNRAAARAEQGLVELRAASDEALDLITDRIDKARQLAAKLEKLVQQAPAAARLSEAEDERAQERRLGALLAAAREARARPERLVAREPLARVERAREALTREPLTREEPRREAPTRSRPSFEDDLFEDPPAAAPGGGR